MKKDKPRLYGPFPPLNTKVTFIRASNPKIPGSKAWHRYNRYSKATPQPRTIEELLNAGAIR
jgi:hypothetical protein